MSDRVPAPSFFFWPFCSLIELGDEGKKLSLIDSLKWKRDLIESGGRLSFFKISSRGTGIFGVKAVKRRICRNMTNDKTKNISVTSEYNYERYLALALFSCIINAYEDMSCRNIQCKRGLCNLVYQRDVI